jgi:hypothetical protein
MRRDEGGKIGSWSRQVHYWARSSISSLFQLVGRGEGSMKIHWQNWLTKPYLLIICLRSEPATVISTSRTALYATSSLLHAHILPDLQPSLQSSQSPSRCQSRQDISEFTLSTEVQSREYKLTSSSTASLALRIHSPDNVEMVLMEAFWRC